MPFIAKHCAEISPRCFQMYSAPRSACLCSASSLCLVFQIYPLLHFVPEAIASFSIPSRGVPHSRGDARHRQGSGSIAGSPCSHSLRGMKITPGRPSCAGVGRDRCHVCSYGIVEAAAGRSARLRLPCLTLEKCKELQERSQEWGTVFKMRS